MAWDWNWMSFENPIKKNRVNAASLGAEDKLGWINWGWKNRFK